MCCQRPIKKRKQKSFRLISSQLPVAGHVYRLFRELDMTESLWIDRTGPRLGSVLNQTIYQCTTQEIYPKNLSKSKCKNFAKNFCLESSSATPYISMYRQSSAGTRSRFPPDPVLPGQLSKLRSRFPPDSRPV